MIRSVAWAILFALLNASGAKAISDWDQMYRDGGALGKITLQVRDDQGVPVDGANVEAYFNASPKGISLKGRTEKDGSIVVEGKSMDDVRFTIQKEGYYKSSNPYNFPAHAPSQKEAIQSGRWMPLNPSITMTLKKIRNPVPMRANDIHGLSIPCDKPTGFDLEVGDFVAPYGKGVLSDLIFTVKTRVVGGREMLHWTCSFSNAMDGMQRLEQDSWSGFKMVYEAPMDGYLKVYEPEDTSVNPPKQAREKEEKHYYLVFRVRSRTDKKGQLTSARYGKMWDGVAIGGGSKGGCSIGFGYWFNPDGTRNLEFDPQKNLIDRARGKGNPINQP